MTTKKTNKCYKGEKHCYETGRHSCAQCCFCGQFKNHPELRHQQPEKDKCSDQRGNELCTNFKDTYHEWNARHSKCNFCGKGNAHPEPSRECPDCSLEDEHIFPDDRSTTRISRPCGGCGKHQTIAGALLKSKYWKEWYDHASKNMLYDVDETLTVDAMSDEHFEDFISFLLLSERTALVEEIEKMIKEELEAKPADDLEKTAEWYKISALKQVINLITKKKEVKK